MKISYKPTFLRDFKKLPKEVQEEAREKINLFKDERNHKKLKVHKLKGKLKAYHSFSITYSHRLVFFYETKRHVIFLTIGTHDVYK